MAGSSEIGREKGGIGNLRGMRTKVVRELPFEVHYRVRIVLPSADCRCDSEYEDVYRYADIVLGGSCELALYKADHGALCTSLSHHSSNNQSFLKTPLFCPAAVDQTHQSTSLPSLTHLPRIAPSQHAPVLPYTV